MNTNLNLTLFPDSPLPSKTTYSRKEHLTFSEDAIEQAREVLDKVLAGAHEVPAEMRFQNTFRKIASEVFDSADDSIRERDGQAVRGSFIFEKLYHSDYVFALS